MNELFENAKEYARKGICIFPVIPKNKKRFPHHKLRIPSCDTEQIEYWWNLFPTANIAASTSLKFNSLVVIDVDVKNGIDGRESLKRIVKENDLVLPTTSYVRTGTGGVHYYYINTTGLPISSSAGKQLGIDIRAERAYVILPPSVHKNGNLYKWVYGDISSAVNVNDDVLRFVELVNSINRNEKDN